MISWTQRGQVLPGQILHAAAEPVTEDEHTTVLLQNGGAVDIRLALRNRHQILQASTVLRALADLFMPRFGTNRRTSRRGCFRDALWHAHRLSETGCGAEFE